ncbi:hypothetical protein DPMN_122332, partial [Dreissena polymorpha]
MHPVGHRCRTRIRELNVIESEAGSQKYQTKTEVRKVLWQRPSTKEQDWENRGPDSFLR